MEDCIFCKIASRAIPATLVHEDKTLIAFNDINPKAPTHQLIIPRQHIATIDDLQPEDAHLVGEMVLLAQQLARKQKLVTPGFRLVFNCNAGGGQEVYHIHLHLLGGRQMHWPPG